MSRRASGVGPVLQAGQVAGAVVEAIRALQPGVVVEDRGAYLRVFVPGRCRVTREAIEEALGAPFHLPGDLERVMPSFKGKLTVTSEEATWEAGVKRE